MPSQVEGRPRGAHAPAAAQRLRGETRTALGKGLLALPEQAARQPSDLHPLFCALQGPHRERHGSTPVAQFPMQGGSLTTNPYLKYRCQNSALVMILGTCSGSSQQHISGLSLVRHAHTTCPDLLGFVPCLRPNR